MASWKCPKCGYNNVFGNADFCGSCGYDRQKLDAKEIERLEREKLRLTGFMVTTTPTLEGGKILKYFGIVNAVIVLGTGFFSDIEAGVADFVGARAGGYQQKLNNATDAVLVELTEKAINRSPEVNALVGLKLDYTVGEKNIMILCGTATAVKYEKGE